MMRRFFILLFAHFLSAAPALAQESLKPATMSVHGQSLIMNGHGVRSVIFIDVYRCALYLPERELAFEKIVSPETTVAIQIVVLYGNTPHTMPDTWRAVLREELTNRLFRRIKSAYQDLEISDRLTLTYAKGRGTRILINGQHLLTDPGHGLMAEFLHMWLGHEPVSDDLRVSLLPEDEEEKVDDD